MNFIDNEEKNRRSHTIAQETYVDGSYERDAGVPRIDPRS